MSTPFLRHSGFGFLSSFVIPHSSLEFQFGGWLQSLAPALAWCILAAVAVAGFALIVFLYRRTLRELSPARRIALTALRVALLLMALFVLANPSRVQRPPHEEKKTERRLVVLVDRSASMNAADNRNETRLANALRVWKPHTDEAAKAFDQVDYRRFSTRIENATSLDDASQTGGSGDETHLWKAINDSLADTPAGVVCLTDGLDTSSAASAEPVSEAQRRGVPLYFVAARNRSRLTELLSIRDVKTPSKVLRHSKFTASAVLEISASRDRNVPIELWSNQRKLASANLPARAGWNVLPWSAEISAGERGPMPLEFRLGEGAAQEIAASTTQVVDKTSADVLYYQGALQWGYRFLIGALETDPSFRLTTILNPALGVKITSSATGAKLVDLPDNAEALKRFQIIVLAHVLADQLSTKQEQALIDYAKKGGGVLFIAPDSEATERFAGTALEQMLPVVFDRTKTASQEAAARAFQQSMRSAFEPDPEDAIAAEGKKQDLPELVPFEVPPGAASILKRDLPKPKFSNYARISRAKPAAEILAVHPKDRTAGNTPRILLARQQFGAGFTVAMTTDLLWRWKMSLPSDSHSVETFWQQLILSLAPFSGEGLRLVKTSSTTAVNRPATVHILGAITQGPRRVIAPAPSGDPSGEPITFPGAWKAPDIVAISPSGERRTLTATALSDDWQATFTPNVAGRWQLSATDSAGNTARIILPVSAEVRTMETANLPSDVETMRRVAESTGGALIDREPAFRRAEAASPVAEASAKTSQPLWNKPWLMGLFLGLYAVELVTRRFFRLL